MSEPVAVPVPQINPNDEHAIVVRWHVDKGERVRAGQTLVTLETTKTAFDVEAPQDGYAFFDSPPHAEVAVGAPIAWIADTDKLASTPVASPPPSAAAAAPAAPAARFTRKALKLMKERGLTEADFPGDERVDADAVERAAAARNGAGPAAAARPSAARTAAASGAERIELSATKVAEAHALQRVYRDVVPSSVTVALDCARVDAQLQRLAGDGGPVSLLEVCIYEAARLLPEWPELNGFYADGAAWRYPSAAVGFAVNLSRGLRVPVVRNAAELALHGVAQRVRDLTLRYMRDELTIDDVAGGTFTITDLSAEGVVHVVPVLNERQAAILGITAQRGDARTRDLVLTFDHRLADGMQAARFLAALRAKLEGGEE